MRRHRYRSGQTGLLLLGPITDLNRLYGSGLDRSSSNPHLPLANIYLYSEEVGSFLFKFCFFFVFPFMGFQEVLILRLGTCVAASTWSGWKLQFVRLKSPNPFWCWGSHNWGVVCFYMTICYSITRKASLVIVIWDIQRRFWTFFKVNVIKSQHFPWRFLNRLRSITF